MSIGREGSKRRQKKTWESLPKNPNQTRRTAGGCSFLCSSHMVVWRILLPGGLGDKLRAHKKAAAILLSTLPATMLTPPAFPPLNQ